MPCTPAPSSQVSGGPPTSTFATPSPSEGYWTDFPTSTFPAPSPSEGSWPSTNTFPTPPPSEGSWTDLLEIGIPVVVGVIGLVTAWIQRKRIVVVYYHVYHHFVPAR
jgi:hypothetical protein